MEGNVDARTEKTQNDAERLKNESQSYGYSLKFFIVACCNVCWDESNPDDADGKSGKGYVPHFVEIRWKTDRENAKSIDQDD